MTYAKPLESNCPNQTKLQKKPNLKCLCHRKWPKKMLFPLGFLHYIAPTPKKPQAKTPIAKTTKLPTRNFAMRQQQFTWLKTT
jgi:hypothetical protein